MPNDSSKLTETPLSTDLLNLYDEFTETHDYCAFLCEAFTSLLAEDHCLDKNTAMGASRFCYLIKQRMGELKGELKQIHEKAHAQSRVHGRKAGRKRGKRHAG